MKRILALVLVAASLLTITTSCQKNKYGTYEFFTTHWYNVGDSERLTKFESHIKALDCDAIEALLLPYATTNEKVTISLWSMDPGQRWLGYIFRKDGLMKEE